MLQPDAAGTKLRWNDNRSRHNHNFQHNRWCVDVVTERHALHDNPLLADPCSAQQQSSAQLLRPVPTSSVTASLLAAYGKWNVVSTLILFRKRQYYLRPLHC